MIDKNVIYGVNINNDEKINIIAMILTRLKITETRKARLLKSGLFVSSLDKLIGQKVGLICTGKHAPVLVGYATITRRLIVDSLDLWNDLFNDHRIPKNSSFSFSGCKALYYLDNIEVLDKPLLIAKCTRPAAYRKIEIIGVAEHGYY